MSTEPEILEPIELNSCGTPFLWVGSILFFLSPYWLIHSPDKIVVFSSLILSVMSFLGILQMTFGKLIICSAGFSYSFLLRKKFISWDDVENIHIIVTGRGHLKNIAWSHSDRKRSELKMEPLRFRAKAFDKSISGYWRGFEPKDVSQIMNRFREAYREKNNEPSPVYPVWDNGLPLKDQ